MSHDWYTLDELAAHLGRDRREIEKLASRGRIPGRKVKQEWKFHSIEITHWLEKELREYSEPELKNLEKMQQSTELEVDVPVSSLLDVRTVQVPLDARTKRSVLETMIEVAGRTWEIWEPASVLKAVQDREEVLSTAFDNGVAIPHPRNPLPDCIGKSILAFGKTSSGIPFGAPKRQLTDMFFLVLATDSRTHLHVLARLGRLLQISGFVDELRGTQTSEEAFELICKADEKTVTG